MPGNKKRKNMPKKGSDAAFAAAEAQLEKLMNQGKVNSNNIFKIKERIAKRFGAYPMGGTR
jgi:hypothetical protein